MLEHENKIGCRLRVGHAIDPPILTLGREPRGKVSAIQNPEFSRYCPNPLRRRARRRWLRRRPGRWLVRNASVPFIFSFFFKSGKGKVFVRDFLPALKASK